MAPPAAEGRGVGAGGDSGVVLVTVDADERAEEVAEPDGEERSWFRWPKLYAMEPASFKTLSDGGRQGRFVQPPALLFTSFAPTCSICGEVVEWVRRGAQHGDGWIYHVRCSCGEDEILSPARLCAGGTAEWWKERGWNLHLRR